MGCVCDHDRWQAAVRAVVDPGVDDGGADEADVGLNHVGWEEQFRAAGNNERPQVPGRPQSSNNERGPERPHAPLQAGLSEAAPTELLSERLRSAPLAAAHGGALG